MAPYFLDGEVETVVLEHSYRTVICCLKKVLCIFSFNVMCSCETLLKIGTHGFEVSGCVYRASEWCGSHLFV